MYDWTTYNLPEFNDLTNDNENINGKTDYALALTLL